MRTNIKKEQRFRHSAEVKCHLWNEHNVGGEPYRDGKRSGTYYDIDKNTHLNVKDGEIGPATNLHIVAVLSVAGLLALLFIFFIMPHMGGV